MRLFSLISTALCVGESGAWTGSARLRSPQSPQCVEAAEQKLPVLLERLRHSRRVRTPLASLGDVEAFCNEQFEDGLLAMAMHCTELGRTAKRKNSWNRGSWTPASVRVEAIEAEQISLCVGVKGRSGAQDEVVSAVLPLGGRCETADELRAALFSLAAEAGVGHVTAARLLSLPGSTDDWSLPDDLWLNETPNRRSVRQMFYDDLAGALQAAVGDVSCPRRMRVTITPPELNMEMDSYRVGTLLELVRHVALQLSESGFARLDGPGRVHGHAARALRRAQAPRHDGLAGWRGGGARGLPRL